MTSAQAPLTRSRARALHAARHALRVPPVPRDFRADIEGMRAVAVLGVMLWHAGVTLLPGGFTGVDVFFVVSGFLMTSLLLEEGRSRGRIDLARFYARRARRLLPAALAALAGTALMTVLFLPRARWSEVGGDLVASATYVVNWRMAWRSVDYLDLERAPSPLQHYWSLSVEEQFYLVWPVILLGILVYAAGRARVFGALTWTITLALFGGSLALSWWWTLQEPAAYFVTPTRVHELMLGAIVALGARAWPRLPRWVAAAVGWVGLALIVLSLLVITRETPFPGLWALLPTGGTALVLLAGPAAGRGGPVLLLRWAPLQWVGRLSYSLYLWHWPFVAVAAELAHVGRGGPSSLPVGWGLVALLLSVVPAWLSFVLVEDPVRRHGRVLAARLTPGQATWRTLRLGLNCTLAGAVLGVAVMVAAPPSATESTAAWRTPEVVDEMRSPVGADTLAVGVDEPAPATAPGELPTLATSAGSGVSDALGEPPAVVEVPQEVGELAVPLEQVADDIPALEPQDCFVSLSGTRVGVCEGGDPDGATTVALIGDSHASMWMTALDAIGRDRGWKVVAMTKSSCPPARDLTIERTGQASDYRQCSTWQDNLDEALREQDPDVVLLSSASYGATGAEKVAAGLGRRVDMLTEEGMRAALVRDVPRAPFDVPACLLENRQDVPRCAFDRQEGLDTSGTGHELLAEQRPELPVLDFTTAVCPGRTCSPIVGEVVVWRDSNHLSATYVRSLRDVVEEQVAPVVLADQVGETARAGVELGTGR
ncbi:O-antigen acetylase [Serinicoccus hydrothermalis]|uniref:O-antigen acetylase n=1 Tax=Serinicoccus hydrothermalis TaxID=1758689 RepID=A0A1B1NCY9_9MICO|nr:acyltransferase family protein [Serinicoccus hydrothermalis]ANS79286.1 O-antigen acetylase [Serinicoccus hydrothermalis]